MGAKNKVVLIDGIKMDYIVFGKGKKVLIMIPGLGDGLKTVRGMAVPFSLMYGKYAKKYRVYVFSRKRELPESYSSREMAEDLKKAMDILGIEKADDVGVSQGGTIAQYLAIDYPDAVNKLVLTVTYSQQNDVVQNVVNEWLNYAETNDFGQITVDTAEKSYSEKYLRKNRRYFPLLKLFTKPVSSERFITMAKACLTHNSYDNLHKISCPTLIIGGKEDKIVTPEASEETAERIDASELYMYDGLGHGLYEEAKDYDDRVLSFLMNDC